MAAASTGLSTAPAKPARMPRGLIIGAVVCGLIVVGLLGVLAYGLSSKDAGDVGPATVPFTQAPDFKLGLLGGGSMTLSDALAPGKPLVMNFWASWCQPCIDEAPTLQAVAAKNSADFTFLGVNVQDVDADARSFIRKYGITYPNGSGNAAEVSIDYGMRGMPETYFISPSGRVVSKWNGPMDEGTLNGLLAHLKQASASAAGS